MLTPEEADVIRNLQNKYVEDLNDIQHEETLQKAIELSKFLSGITYDQIMGALFMCMHNVMINERKRRNKCEKEG